MVDIVFEATSNQFRGTGVVVPTRVKVFFEGLGNLLASLGASWGNEVWEYTDEEGNNTRLKFSNAVWSENPCRCFD